MSDDRLYVVGLDLSLSSAGVVILPQAWKPGDWTEVRHECFGYNLKEDKTAEARVVRLDMIVSKIDTFISQTSVSVGSMKIFCEDYAHGKVFGAHRLGELGGSVKLHFYKKYGLVVQPVANTSARKFLLGYSRVTGVKGQVKRDVFTKLLEIGAPFAPNAKKKHESDEADAFSVANFGLSELDLPALSFAS